MGTSPKRHRRPRVRSLKSYVGIWTGSILLSFLLLIGAWFTVQAHLRQMKQEILSDTRALDAARTLESHLLTEDREDLLWRVTGDAEHRTHKLAALQQAVEAAEHLSTAGASPEEVQLVEDLRTRLLAVRDEAASLIPPPLEKSRPLAEGLLAIVRRYIEKNQSDMEMTIRAALRLQSGIDYSAIGVVAAVGLLLTVGSLSLLRRVIGPTLELTRVARRFGQGDFSARATVTQDDELGALCRTFNHMAEETASHERTRLEFVAMVAHDLKSPLITIGGGARRLRSGKLGPEQQAAWLDRIITQAARLEKLTHDLMDTVQISTGRLCVNRARLDLAALLREVCREQAGILSDHSLRFEGGEECPVLGDRDRIERVVTNLVSNAAKYSPKGSTIEVKVARQESLAFFTVRDEGAGIAPEDLKAIFEPFGRGSQAHQMAKGTGLGMNVVKHILEAHDGSITIRSEVGKGTTVEVTLPLALS